MRILIYALLVLAVFSFKVNWLNWNSKPEKKVSAGTDQLSIFYCGFGDKFCGQSVDDDVHPATTNVILAFVNTQTDGSVIMDEPNFPTQPFNSWKAAGKNVLISVGGQNGNWNNVFASQTSIDNFVNSLVDIVTRFKLDGVDLDIESFNDPPRKVITTVKKLKTALVNAGSKGLLIMSPESVTVFQSMGVPDVETGGGYYNYFVPIIREADEYIDFYQPQAYNDWYEFPSGSLEYLQDVYLNWRNFQGMTPWGCKPLDNFKGVAGQKLIMGVLASTSAGGSAYYYTPDVIASFKSWLDKNSYPLAGFMMWDSHWDTLNNNTISNACTK